MGVDGSIPSRLHRTRRCEGWRRRTTGQISDRNRRLGSIAIGIAVTEKFVLGPNRYRRKAENHDSQDSRREAGKCFPKSHTILDRLVRACFRLLTLECPAAILQKYQTR